MPTQSDNPNRRQFMRRVGTATLGAGAAYYGGTQHVGSPVQNGQAIAPLVAVGAVGAVAAGSVALGWALREYEVVGSDPPAEGLTADVLKNDVVTTIKTRRSTNASTIIDNANILDGVRNTAYADAKIAALEKLNQQETEANVLAAANAAINDYEDTVLGNFLKTWNESVNELLTLATAVNDHPDVGIGNVFTNDGSEVRMGSGNYDDQGGTRSISAVERTHTTPGGTDITYQRVGYKVKGTSGFGPVTIRWDPFNNWGEYHSGTQMISVNIGNGREDYLKRPEWSSMRSKIQSAFSDVRNNISTWVSNVYGEVQSGTIDTSELLTPREQAQIAGEEEGTPQALADLQALNIPVDLDREAEVYLPNPDATIYGQLSYTGSSQVEVGTINPNATDADGNDIYPGSFYLTYDISRGQGTWTEYNEGIDGGNITFTSEPYAETTFRVHTVAGETAEVTVGDFTDNGDGTWTADLSGQLDNAITTAEKVTFEAQTDQTQYETIQLQDTFVIKSFTDSSGNEYASSNFENSEPQDDTNYITEEEWKAQQKRNEELIQKYEDSQKSGGGGINLSALDAFGLPGEIVGLIIVVVGGFLINQ